MYVNVCLLLVSFLSVVECSTQSKQEKRQIYREQVLPHSGGKIPDGAFATDRLALNRLNKAGISIPDGVLLEHRHVFSHPHANQHDPEDEDDLVKLVQKPEDRYVASVGVYHNEKPLTVSSTYIIRKPTHSTNIRTPNQQMPLHELLSAKELGTNYGAYLPIPTPEWRPFRFEDNIPPPAYTFEHHAPPVRNPYPHVKESVAYYPVTVPLEIPNKKNQKVKYPQGGAVRYHETEDKTLSWPYLLGEYTRLADEINTISHGPYLSPAQHSLFFTPEVIPPFESYYYKTRDRYARTSKEISFTENISDRVKSKDARTVIKLRCTVGSENRLDGHDTKCRLRY